MSDLTLIRLTVNDPTAWSFWPVLERRVRVALPDLEPEAPPDAVIAMLRDLWVNKPAMIGAWFALRPDGDVAAHMLAWIDVYWGQPCLNVYQLVGDPGAGSLDLLEPALHELGQWKAALNALYARAGDSRRIDLVRFYTTRPDAYVRWFKPLVEVRRGGTICSFRLSDVAVPSLEG